MHITYFFVISIQCLVADLSSCQIDVDVLHRVAFSWDLRCNASKCSTLRFSRATQNWSVVGALETYNLCGVDLGVEESVRDLGILVDSSLRFHAHVRQVVGKNSGLANNILRSTLCRSPEFMCNVYITHVRPLLEFGSCVWNTGFVGDGKLLESIQRHWTRNISGLDNLSYSERLHHLDLYSVKGRLIRADLIKYYKISSGLSVIGVSDLFVLSPSSHTRGHRFKILKPHVSLECRRRFFSVRCIDLWNSLPDEVVSCSSLDAFKSSLHRVLGDLLNELED